MKRLKIFFAVTCVSLVPACAMTPNEVELIANQQFEASPEELNDECGIGHKGCVYCAMGNCSIYAPSKDCKIEDGQYKNCAKWDFVMWREGEK